MKKLQKNLKMKKIKKNKKKNKSYFNFLIIYYLRSTINYKRKYEVFLEIEGKILEKK